jgi:hypothetical protein
MVAYISRLIAAFSSQLRAFSGPFANCYLENQSEDTTMNIPTKIAALIVSAGLAVGVAAQAKEKKHEEENVNSADVPAAVQKTAKAEAKGGKIVRWEKENGNYEAVIEKNGKETGVAISSDGKVLNRHNEKDEHKEKSEKY